MSSPKPDTDTTRDIGDGKDPTAAGDAGASSEQSGYRRDDYWRKSQQGLPADAESEPANGQAFETPGERARSGVHELDDDGADDAGAADDDSGRTDEAPQASPPHAK